jgi:hypothetical protein
MQIKLNNHKNIIKKVLSNKIINNVYFAWLNLFVYYLSNQ